MIYRAKLSRRLARLRGAPMLYLCFVLAACQAGSAIGGLDPQDPALNPIIVSIDLRTARATYATDEGALIESKGRTSTGQTVDADTEWQAIDGGTVTAVGDGSKALFRSTSTGTFRVVGKGKGWGKGGNPNGSTTVPEPEPVDTVQIVIEPPPSPLASISVTPVRDTVYRGWTQLYTVTGTRADGSSASPAVTWRATGGSVDAGGYYVAPQTDATYVVIATTTDEALADSGAAVVTVAPTQEPQGYTAIAENSMDAVPGSTTSTSAFLVSLGSWGNDISNSNFTVQSDPSAQQSAANVVQVRWPAGMKDGVSPGKFWANFGATYRELYVSYRVRIPTTTFENQTTGTKLLGYLSYGKTDRSNQFFLMMYGGGGKVTSGPWGFRADFTSEYGGPDLNPNIGTGNSFTAGTWHHIELLFKLNDDGVANGVFKMWDNGVLTHNYSNVTMVGSRYGTMAGYRGLSFAPGWGGVNGTIKSRDDFMYIDHIKVSGIRQ
jgi:hypothetical protein